MTREIDFKKYFDRLNIYDGISIDEDSDLSINLIIGSKYLNHFENQVMVVVSAILISKFCSKINLFIEKDAPCNLNGYEGNSFSTVISQIIGKSVFKNQLEIHNSIPPDNSPKFVIGQLESKLDSTYTWIDCNNWIAGLGFNTEIPNLRKTETFNVASAAFVSCLGVAHIFKILLKKDDQNSFSKFFSLFDYSTSKYYKELQNPEFDHAFDFKNLYTVGSGAVGSSFSYLLSICQELSGNNLIIDFDEVQEENLISSLLFNSTHLGKKKVEVAHHLFDKNEKIFSDPIDDDYHGFLNSISYSEYPPSLILCFANERNIWSSIQENLPPTVMHSTTTENWGINFGKHTPIDDWCIVCRFGVNSIEYIPVCSESDISSSKNTDVKLGVLPFLSPLAASITLAEFFKFYLSLKSDSNFVTFSTKNISNSKFLLQKKNKRKDCEVCLYQDESIYKEFLEMLS